MARRAGPRGGDLSVHRECGVRCWLCWWWVVWGVEGLRSVGWFVGSGGSREACLLRNSYPPGGGAVHVVWFLFGGAEGLVCAWGNCSRNRRRWLGQGLASAKG